MMISNARILFYVSILFTVTCLFSCGNNDKDKPKPNKDSAVRRINVETKKQANSKTVRPPIVNIADTTVTKTLVIYCKDSAANFERISLKLGKIYGVKLAEYIKKNNLKMAGAPMAWYKNQKAPYFFEAGVAINKAGKKTVAGVLTKEMATGRVVIAHFFGPFELLPQGYDAVKEWMKDNKKITNGAPYEIYITDPFDKNGKPVDPYKIQTDIVFPVK